MRRNTPKITEQQRAEAKLVTETGFRPDAESMVGPDGKTGPYNSNTELDGDGYSPSQQSFRLMCADLGWGRTREHTAEASKQMAVVHKTQQLRAHKSAEMTDFSDPQGLRLRKIKEGEHIYAFASAPPDRPEGTAGKGPFSPYYMREAEYKSLFAPGSPCLNADGSLNATAVKDRYALPCSNRCDQVVKRKVVHTHLALQSSTGEVWEQYHTKAQDGTITGTHVRKMEGGGKQVLCDYDCLEQEVLVHDHSGEFQGVLYTNHREEAQRHSESMEAERDPPVRESRDRSHEHGD